MGKRFQVAASPLNQVKFDLAIVFVISVLLLIIADKLFNGFWAQFLFLAGYGLVAMTWIIRKVRRVVINQQNGHKNKRT